MSIKLKDTIYDLINNSDKLSGVVLSELTKYLFKRGNCVKELTTSDDLNNLTYNLNSLGYYTSPDNTTILNSPIQNFGLLSISINTTYTGQFIFGYNGNLYYRRQSHNGTSIVWNNWRTVAFTDSNISGNAATASKLATARTISLTGSVTGSGSFDGIILLLKKI